MSQPFTAFKNLFDFSLWEKAVQAFFCDTTQGGGLFITPPDNSLPEKETWQPPAGKTVFLIGNQAQTHQQARPRVGLAPINYTPFDNAIVIDANNRRQVRGWRVPLDLYVVTQADYATHTSLLATVRACASFMQPLSDNALAATTGLNAFLTFHELAMLQDAGGPTFGGAMSADKNSYVTPIKLSAIFAVRSNQWPGGTTTT